MTVPSGSLTKELGRIRAEMGSFNALTNYDGSSYPFDTQLNISMGDMANQMNETNVEGSYFSTFDTIDGPNRFNINDDIIDVVGNFNGINTTNAGDVSMDSWGQYHHLFNNIDDREF